VIKITDEQSRVGNQRQNFEPELGLNLETGWGDPIAAAEERKGLWFHVQARESLVLVVLSTEPVRFAGHWMERRFHLCRSGCPCDKTGWPRESRWAVSVMEIGTGRVGQIECGALTAKELMLWCQKAGALRGLVLRWWKENQHRFGRLCCAPTDAVINSRELPEATDVEASIMKSFGSSQMRIPPSR
jgi:hypothetical protein